MARNPYATWTKQPKKVALVVTGIPEIDRKLKELEPKVQRKVLRQAMRKGMKLVLAEAKARVPVLTGLTAENLKLKAGKRSRSRARLDVKVQNAEGLVKTTKAGKRYFYPALVEYLLHPFMRPSFDDKGPTAKDTTMRELLEGALREAKS